MKKNHKKLRKPRKSHSLSIVQYWYPHVDSVNDADNPMNVVVTQGDVDHAEVKSHNTCALAIACRRKFHADGVIIAITTAYVVKGLKAIRFKLGPSIGREITVFDRKGPFKAGIYQLSPPSPSNRLGMTRSYDPVRMAKNGGKLSRKRFIHYTEDVRTSLTRLPADKILKNELRKLKKRLK